MPLHDLSSLYFDTGPRTPTDCSRWFLNIIPDAWVSDTAKKPGGLLNKVAQAVGNALFFLYHAARYQQMQTRVHTATDINLDLISSDYFGGTLPRFNGETDAAYRIRILQDLLTNKATRAGLEATLTDMGLTFSLVEDGNTGDILALGTYGGLGTLGSLGADQLYGGDCYLTIQLPLPLAITQSQVLAAINAVKPEGTTVWTAFV